MQTQTEIRELLSSAQRRPNRHLGQCFLVDGNLMGKLLDLAELTGRETVLEVGPGTGSLTEELLARAARVVAVEVDPALAALLRQRLGGREGLTLIEGDVLAGKHALSPAVLAAVGRRARLVSNLPYGAATPVLMNCLLSSWRSLARQACTRFERLTFTVQREVADRLTARAGEGAYGPVSVLAALLGELRAGPPVPATAFWPRPKVASRILRIDFAASAASRLRDAETLRSALRLAFGQRRKQLGALPRRASLPVDRGVLAAAMQAAGIDPCLRAEQVPPEQYLLLANALPAATEP